MEEDDEIRLLVVKDTITENEKGGVGDDVDDDVDVVVESSPSPPSLEFCETIMVGPVPMGSNWIQETTHDVPPPTFQQDEQLLVSRRSAIVTAFLATGVVLPSIMSVGAAEAKTTDDEELFIHEKRSMREQETRGGSRMKDPSSTTSLVLGDSAAAAAAVDWKSIVQKASKRALGGGKAGAAAAVVQVGSLMWLRTSMNYQYRYGGTLQSSLQTLWQDGGVARLYQGLPFALLQGPLTRFGDTAANVGILALLESWPETQSWPVPLKTACGSVAAGLWRIVLMPIDASKTVMQVEGADGLKRLWGSVVGGGGAGSSSGGEGRAAGAAGGLAPLYQGALAQAAATAAGHFPWFTTYNLLDAQLPVVTASDDLLLSLVRSAVLGLSASCVSDCVSNSLRVIKTTKQTAQVGTTTTTSTTTTAATSTTSTTSSGSSATTPLDSSSSGGAGAVVVGKELSYQQVVALILEKDGVAGLFGRGLQTRLLTNAIQGAVFSVMWKYFQQSGGL